MAKWRDLRGKFVFLLIAALLLIVILSTSSPGFLSSNLSLHHVQPFCSHQTSVLTITPLNDTKHLLVSAYMDQRVKGWDVRILGIFRRDSIQPLYCFYCCKDHWSDGIPAKIIEHSDNFGFPFVTTDIMCRIPPACNATHVVLSPHSGDGQLVNQTLLPIGNQEARGKQEKVFQFNFTVCISNLFGDYNNVLQVTQALEMYRSASNNIC